MRLEWWRARVSIELRAQLERYLSEKVETGVAENQSKCRVPAQLEKYVTEKVETGVAESQSQYRVPGPAREIPLREG